jgi:hypothetical protein
MGNGGSMPVKTPTQIPAEALVTTPHGLDPQTFLIFLALLLAIFGLLFWATSALLKALRRIARPSGHVR